MYSRKILRRMLPIEREHAKLINELESSVRRLKNRLPRIHQAEMDSLAMANQATAGWNPPQGFTSHLDR